MALREIIENYTANDTLPALFRTHPTQGTDITLFTITFRMRRPDGTKLIKTTPTQVKIIDGPKGEFKIVWSAGDLQHSENLQEAEIEYDSTDGRQTEGPIWLKVRKQIG